MTGGLGVEPIKALEHEYGKLALQLLVFGLAISPLRRHIGLNLMKFRRAIGVLTFSFAALHLLVWLVLDVQVPSEIWADIVKRPYITVGMAAFALILPLAVTSNNWSVRRLGSRWRKLHRLVYPAAILGAVHYVMLTKGFQNRTAFLSSAHPGPVGVACAGCDSVDPIKTSRFHLMGSRVFGTSGENAKKC